MLTIFELPNCQRVRPKSARVDQDNTLVEHPGEDAPIHAAMRADAMLEAGDQDGYAVWKRILRAVEELDRMEMEPGSRIH